MSEFIDINTVQYSREANDLFLFYFSTLEAYELNSPSF